MRKWPKREIKSPPNPQEGLYAGYCVFCGGSLGAPYQEDLFHSECYPDETQQVDAHLGATEGV